MTVRTGQEIGTKRKARRANACRARQSGNENPTGFLWHEYLCFLNAIGDVLHDQSDAGNKPGDEASAGGIVSPEKDVYRNSQRER